MYDSIKASDPIKIDKNEPALEFTRNVHDIQRDQYMTDSTETNGKRNGNYVQLQGEKQDLQGHKKQASVKPHVKVILFCTIMYLNDYIFIQDSKSNFL